MWKKDGGVLLQPFECLIYFFIYVSDCIESTRVAKDLSATLEEV